MSNPMGSSLVHGTLSQQGAFSALCLLLASGYRGPCRDRDHRVPQASGSLFPVFQVSFKKRCLFYTYVHIHAAKSFHVYVVKAVHIKVTANVCADADI